MRDAIGTIVWVILILALVVVLGSRETRRDIASGARDIVEDLRTGWGR